MCSGVQQLVSVMKAMNLPCHFQGQTHRATPFFVLTERACCAQQEYQQGLISMGQATGHAGRYEEATKSYESSLQILQACIIYITPYCSIPAHQAQFTTTNVLVALPFHE